MTRSHDDFEFEPVRGLPKPLPPGEKILWQGAPDWKALARRAMRLRPLAFYAFVIVLWRGVTVVYDGGSVIDGLVGAGVLVMVFGAALAMLAGIAYFSARETVYTLTTKRVVMRFGVALTMTVQIPYTKIAAAGLLSHGDGAGDIPVSLVDTERVSYAVMWPHARPWTWRRPEPMLRCVPNAAAVAGVLAAALQADLAETPERSAPPVSAGPPRETAAVSGQTAATPPLAAAAG